MSIATSISFELLRNPRFVRSVLDVNGMLSLGKMQNRACSLFLRPMIRLLENVW